MSVSNKLLFYEQFIKHHGRYVVNLEFDDKFLNNFSNIISEEKCELRNKCSPSCKERGLVEEEAEEKESESKDTDEEEPQEA